VLCWTLSRGPAYALPANCVLCCAALPSGPLVAEVSGPLAAEVVSGASEATLVGVETAAGLDTRHLCKSLLLLLGAALDLQEAGLTVCRHTHV
jgi:hypothetical protein